MIVTQGYGCYCSQEGGTNIPGLPNAICRLWKAGLVSVSNGSSVVTGVDTLWLENVCIGHSFKVIGEKAIYTIASVNSDTQLTLTLNYAGATASGVAYSIGRDFTQYQGFAEVDIDDPDWPFRLTEELRKLDSLLSLATAGVTGLWQVDEYGSLMPISAFDPGNYYELDGSGDIQPKV